MIHKPYLCRTYCEPFNVFKFSDNQTLFDGVLNFKAEWIIPDNRPPETWPQNGNITFKDFDLKYREGLPLVLKSINCFIAPGEKVIILQY